MESNVMVMLNYGRFSVVTRFDQFDSYESIVEFSCNRWNSLKKETISMSYLLAEKRSCMLASEQDFICMGIMIARRNIELLEINVNDLSICVSNVSDSFEKSFSTLCEGSSSRNEDNVKFFYHKEKRMRSAEWADAIQNIGQIFEGGSGEFRNALCKFSTEVGFDFNYVKNEPTRITAVCSHKESKGCPWKIHASIEKCSGYFYIRKYIPDHICKDAISCDFGQRMGCDVLSSVIRDKVRDDPNVSPASLVKSLLTEYGLTVHYKVVWRAVEKAKNIIFGDAKFAYNKLKAYTDKIREVDPDGCVKFESDPVTSRFQRCFFAFGACLRGFKFCRPLLFLDATFLTGMFRGTLLAATAKDGDNGLFHVAFAVVGSEDTENWTWFLQNLRPYITERGVTFVSDRHQGIINAVHEVMPFLHHSFCMFHLKNNLRNKLGGLSKEVRSNILHKFSKLSKAPTPEHFQILLDEIINEGGTKVSEFFNNLPKENYAASYFGGHRYGEVYSNAAESFNAMIKEYKSLPVVELIDSIRLKIMSRKCRRKQDSNSWANVLCPSIQKVYLECADKGRSWIIHACDEYVFEVHSDPSMVVNIQEYTCSCGMWQQNGFPCVHSISVFSRFKNNSSSFIQDYFKVRNYRESYALSIPAISTLCPPVVDGESVVLPPETKRPR